MANIMQLTHPAGKKAVRMDQHKYDVVKNALLRCLKSNGQATHTEILQAIARDFSKNKTQFDGSLEWYMEWVKLDLEAKQQIKRIADKSPACFALA